MRLARRKSRPRRAGLAAAPGGSHRADHRPRTIEQLDEPQRAVKLALRPDTLERLDAILPGYQPALEHYVWGSHRWPALATPVAGRSVFLAAAGQH
jgi:hypothetical protein